MQGASKARKGRVPGKRRPGRPSATKDANARPPSVSECFLFRCNEVLDRLKKKDHYNIFLKPVNADQVAGYRETVKSPMDFSTMGKKLKAANYKSLGEFRRDLDLIWSNCLLFNGAEPNNVFSKKAIELRKLTEKLIATTRTSLEKDKEELYRWKERQRAIREARAAAAGGNPTAPGLNLSLALGGVQGPAGLSLDSPIPGQSNSARISPREALNYALRQLLREQYGGNTGLFQREQQGSLPQHYIAADGSAVNIPSVRYEPDGRHWDEPGEPLIGMKRKLDLPDAVYHRLRPMMSENAVHPCHAASYIKVGDFVRSVQAFVENAGDIPNKIVAEFLAPEIAIRDKEVKRRRVEAGGSASANPVVSGALSTNSGASAGSSARPSETDEKPSPPDALLATCKVSIFPKVKRQIAELDGEEGLERLLGPELAEEVRNVPVNAIDFAMPYGLSPSGLMDIMRLIIDPRLRIDRQHQASLDEVRRATDDTVSKIGVQFRTMHGGASVLSTGEIHEIQTAFSRQASVLAKSISMQQSKMQAQRVAQAEAARVGGAGRSQVGAGGGLPSMGLSSVQGMLAANGLGGRPQQRYQGHSAGQYASRASPAGAASTAGAIANVLGQSTPTAAPASLQHTLMKIASDQNAGRNPAGVPVGSQAHAGSRGYPNHAYGQQILNPNTRAVGSQMLQPRNPSAPMSNPMLQRQTPYTSAAGSVGSAGSHQGGIPPRGYPNPLAEMMSNPPSRKQQPGSQIGKEIDGFPIPGMQRASHHAASAGMLQRQQQMLARAPSPSGSQGSCGGVPFGHSGQMAMNPGGINPGGMIPGGMNAAAFNGNFGGLAQQASAVGGHPRQFNPSQQVAGHQASNAIANPLTGLPQFMGGNGGLSLPGNTAAMASIGTGVGHVRRALHGPQAINPAMNAAGRNGVQAGMFAQQQQQHHQQQIQRQQQSQPQQQPVHNMPNVDGAQAAQGAQNAPPARLAPLGQINGVEDAGEANGGGQDNGNVAADIDNLFKDGESFGNFSF